MMENLAPCCSFRRPYIFFLIKRTEKVRTKVLMLFIISECHSTAVLKQLSHQKKLLGAVVYSDPRL